MVGLQRLRLAGMKSLSAHGMSPSFRVEDVSSQATNLETARRGQKDSFWNNPQEQPHRSTKKLSEHFWGSHADADFVSRHENSWEHILI